MKRFITGLILAAFVITGSFGGAVTVQAKAKTKSPAVKSVSAPKVKAPAKTKVSVPVVKVNGYTKKNGTYVAPHYRTAPDSKKSNNWSTKGNVNPITGKKGTKK